jgi:chromatin remodeling complex protein RSC6
MTTPTQETQATQEPQETENVFEDRVTDLVGRLEVTFKEIKSITSELKTLRKEHIKIVKKAIGRRKKTIRDPNAPKKALSGFAKPTKISVELATFLGVSEGDLIARPKVTQGVNEYIKAHNLQKEENKRIIDLSRDGGKELRQMLRVPEGEELSYFNLQTYLKIHFPLSKKAAAAAAASSAPTKTETEGSKPTRRRAKAREDV